MRLLKQLTLVWQYIFDRLELARVLLLNESTESSFAKKLFALPAFQRDILSSVSEEHDETSRRLIIIFLQSGAYGLLGNITQI